MPSRSTAPIPTGGQLNYLSMDIQSAATYRQSIAMTAKRVSTVGYSKLEVTVADIANGNDGDTHERTIWVVNANGANWYPDIVAQTTITAPGVVTLAVPSGEYYIAIGIVSTMATSRFVTVVSKVRLLA